MDELERIFDWDAALEDASYYEILGVPALGDEESIRTAFHGFSRAFHPDVHIGASEEVRNAVRRIFQRGAEAYRVLADPELRVRYDLGLQKGILRLDLQSRRPPQSSSPGKSLDAICRSAGAKLCAMKAEKLIGAGDLAGAKRELDRALEHDGGANPELVARIADLEVALYAMGG